MTIGPNLLEMAISIVPRARALQVLLGGVGLGAGEGLGERSVSPSTAASIGMMS